MPASHALPGSPPEKRVGVLQAQRGVGECWSLRDYAFHLGSLLGRDSSVDRRHSGVQQTHGYANEARARLDAHIRLDESTGEGEGCQL